MRKNYILILAQALLFQFLIISAAYGQNSILRGKVRAGGVGLHGATVTDIVSGMSTSTAEDGSYSLNISSASMVRLRASYIGYKALTKSIDLSEATLLDFDLSDESLDEVVVIGSRSVPRTNLETTAPVDVVDIKNLAKDVAQVSLNQLLNYVAPSFNAVNTSINDGTDHIDPASLRGLGPDQVLVLINGKRRHTSALVNVNNSFGRGSVGTDLNAIPTAAIKRVEILRDGAAAQYGSDAIAGVINIVLDDSVNELNVTMSAGGNASRFSQGGMDGEQTQVNLNFGVPIGENGGYINVTGSYDMREAVNRQREFLGTIFTDYNNPTLYPNPTGMDITEAELQRRGLDRTDFVSQVGSSEANGGSAFFNSEVPLGEESSFYAFGGLNFRSGKSGAFRRMPAQLHQNNDAVYPNGFLPFIESSVYDQSFAAGLKTKIDDWHIDFSNTYGQNSIQFENTNTINATMLEQSPRDFRSGGISFLQNTTNFDISKNFETVSQGLHLAFGLEHRYERYQITPGEESSYTDYGQGYFVTDETGVRRFIPDYINGPSTRFAPNGVPYFQGSQGFPGFRPENAVLENRNSFAAYMDTELSITKSWLLTGALRFENYSDFGSTLNWKLSTLYRMSDIYNFRAAASTGFRAPSLHQRYYNATTSREVDGEFLNSGAFQNNSRVAELLGIPSLRQELSQSYSAGFTANWGAWKATVDGYYIRIDDRVVYTGMFMGSTAPDATEQEREIAGLLAQANANAAQFFANAIDTDTKGIDVVLTYNTALGQGHLRADLAGTFVQTNIIGSPNTSEQLAGLEDTYFDLSNRILLESAVPRMKGNLSLNYSYKRFNVFLRNVYFGPVDEATNLVDYMQTFGARLVTDLSLGYQISEKLSWTIGANNLFDIYPDQIRADSPVRNNDIFLYARTGQQFGYFGRHIFTRLAFTLK
ncbi:TonB-dependent receptor [Sphingobacterium sp. lm-10]|uniref:TonB-dependent receptor n=1 Tax=Sphingobacterium sp. lm-10 TaxID=2944904 RepID=UPI0020207D31|nr:TonB-dependent receptor [Sphingobacterium sp. lm-10]MCL7989072.1 TonB-dependent receptor [Sphingobacterium sp. lm-10]